jgi:hypothetical protein
MLSVFAIWENFMILFRKKLFFSDKKIKRLLWAALALAFMISGWNAMVFSARELSVFVRISIKSPESGQAALYYDVGYGFNSRHVSTARVYGDGHFHDVKLKFPFLKILHHMRFDPPDISSGEIVIRKVDIIDKDGRILHQFNLDDLKPLKQIKSFDLVNGNIQFTMDESANDPQIRIYVERPILFDRLQMLVQLLARKAIPEFLISFSMCFILFVSMSYVWSFWKDTVVATLVVLAVVITGWRFYDDFTSIYFKLSMQSAVSGQDAVAELFYDEGYGLSGGNFTIARTHAGDKFHDYTFKIPKKVRYLRLDPMTAAGMILIKKMEIMDSSGRVLKAFPLQKAGPEVSAENQIKEFEFREGVLKIVTIDNANDPQIGIMLDDATRERINGSIFPPLREVMNNLFWTVAFLLLCVLVIKKYRDRIIRLIESRFFLEKLPLICLGCALGVILAMAFISGLDVHPDELGHANSVGYYSDAWLPPSVDDAKVLKTISGYGVSQLFRLEMVYFWAGKFNALVSGLVHYDYLRLRLFNGILFMIIVLIVSRRIFHAPLLAWGLALTPQVWYIFSYFNADGFAFFIAFLLAWQLIDTDSMTRRYLNSTTLLSMWTGGAFYGVLIGSLLLSKMNYYVYIVFILFMIAWDFISDKLVAQRPDNRLMLKKWALIACAAICVYLPPTIYDQYVNDFKKDEKISKFVEKHADYEFKASTIQKALDDSYPGLYLRLKGTLWHEIFLENNYWRALSFYSFFGLYGYMNIYADSQYYELFFLFLIGMVLLFYFYAALTVNFKEGVAFLIMLIFLLLAIGQSTYVSWTGDFQPQGRYLFPMIPIAMVGMSRLNTVFQKRIIPCFNIVLFLFSLISFIYYALLFIPKIT